MQINKYNNTSFTARNYEIRKADNILNKKRVKLKSLNSTLFLN